MPTAKGTIEGTESELICTFVVGETEHKFVATIDSEAPFLAKDTRFTYKDTSSLVGTMTFDCKLGFVGVHLTIGDGYDVSGNGVLTPPVKLVLNINGTGTWSTSTPTGS